jgi:hypothetical protein
MNPDPNPAYVYVFLDEGGDLNFAPKGTKYFTLTTVTKARPFPWDGPLALLRHDLIEQGLDIEYFHAAEDRQAVRDKVFASLTASLADFRIDSLVVEKRKTGPSLQADEQFYPQMIGYLLRYLFQGPSLQAFSEVVVITDSLPVQRKRKAVEKAIKMTLAHMLPSGTKYQVLHHASKAWLGLQVSDYCNWAIFRKWERGDTRSYDLIRGAIRSEFEIFRKGEIYYY